MANPLDREQIGRLIADPPADRFRGVLDRVLDQVGATDQQRGHAHELFAREMSAVEPALELLREELRAFLERTE